MKIINRERIFAQKKLLDNNFINKIVKNGYRNPYLFYHERKKKKVAVRSVKRLWLAVFSVFICPFPNGEEVIKFKMIDKKNV
jgi:hypothetical protein